MQSVVFGSPATFQIKVGKEEIKLCDLRWQWQWQRELGFLLGRDIEALDATHYYAQKSLLAWPQSMLFIIAMPMPFRQRYVHCDYRARATTVYIQLYGGQRSLVSASQ